MKFCLSSRNSPEYLKQADEISVQWRDRDIIYDLLRDYPKADVILTIPEGEENLQNIVEYNKIANNRLIIRLHRLSLIPRIKEMGIERYFYGYPITSFYDLRALANLGVCYVRLGAPLFFELPEVKAVGVPVRAVPDVALVSDIPGQDPLYGTWIRPEDLDKYAPYIDAIEFESYKDNYEKEAALFRIYAISKEWNGLLSQLIQGFPEQDLNDDVGMNNMLLDDALAIRLSCGQKCQSGKSCNICPIAYRIASPSKFQKYLDRVAYYQKHPDLKN